jgi:hypothetical protein
MADAVSTLQTKLTEYLPRGQMAKLVGHGFVEISTANRQDAIAKVTRAGRTSTHRSY